MARGSGNQGGLWVAAAVGVALLSVWKTADHPGSASPPEEPPMLRSENGNSGEWETTTRGAGIEPEMPMRVAGIEPEMPTRGAGIERETPMRVAGIERETPMRVAGIEREMTTRGAGIEPEVPTQAAGIEQEVTTRGARVEGIVSGAVDHANDTNFEEKVLRAPGRVLVDFYADWCGPCRMIAPALEELAREEPRARIAKVNVDHSPQLAAQFGIDSIPALLVFENGRLVRRQAGALSKAQMRSLLGL